MTAAALAKTHAAAFTATRPWSADEFENLLSQPRVILCGDAKSFVLARVIADEAEVLTVATHPDFQGQGKAYAQMIAFCATAKTSGAAQAFLEVADDNEAAKALYHKLKFAIVGRRAKYYQTRDGVWIDAIVLQKRL